MSNSSTQDFSGEHEFQIDLKGLIKLLAKNLYPQADVFVREMLQNAHDSIQKRKALQVLQKDRLPEGKIEVSIDRVGMTITITDNGVGMTKQEVQEYLATIGRSGTAIFSQKREADREAVVTLIGQFGIGLLSAFIVAERVVIETKSWQSDDPAWRWESAGDSTYRLQPGKREEVGTTVTLHLNSKHHDMLNTSVLREAIQKYADFLPVGIYLNDDGRSVNTINAPWHKRYADLGEEQELQDMKKFVLGKFPGDVPLAIIPVHIDDPVVNGVLYVSENRSLINGMVDIYQSRMFVTQADRDILPAWATFVRGVIDSPNLTLPVTRDAVQQDDVHKQVREKLGGVIIEHLTQLSKSNEEKFKQICEWHQTHIKGIAARDKTFFEAVADLIPFETNKGLMSLQTYFERAKKQNQSELLYFDESGNAAQFYIICDAQDLVVVNASHPFEDEFLERYGRLHSDIKLRQLNIGEAGAIFKSLDSQEKQQYEQLEDAFNEQILPNSGKAKAVRFKPETMPALTVLSEEAKRRRKLEQTARDVLTPEEIRKPLLEMLQNQGPIPFTLYVNVDNPIIQKLAASSTEQTKVAYQAIFANAAMLAGQMNDPKNAEAAFKDFSRLIDCMLTLIESGDKCNDRVDDQQKRIENLQKQIDDILIQPPLEPGHLTEHISCFFAMPFCESYDPLLEAVRYVLEDRPYGWQVIRADERYLEDRRTISSNVKSHIAHSHCYLAEISDASPNVYLEIGLMSHYQERPLNFLYCRNAEEPIAANIGGHLYLTYDRWNTERPDIRALAEQLSREFGRPAGLPRAGNGRKIYLSPSLLKRQGFPEDLVERICREYQTVEEFIEAPSSAIVQRIHGAYASEVIEVIKSFQKVYWADPLDQTSVYST